MRGNKFLYQGLFLVINFLYWANPLLAQIPFVCQNNFYFSFSLGSGISQLHEVIIDTNGDVDFIPLPQSTGVIMNAIGYRSTDNLIYGIGVIDQMLYKIDATGRSFPQKILDVNHSNGFYAATITPNGDEMILMEQDFSGSIALVKIDLTNDNYPIAARIPLNGPRIQTTDIAFDPISGLLYGFDANGDRLISINSQNGSVNANFPSSNVADKMGGIYFDAFGNMFGYGDATGENQARTFFGIDKRNGMVTILGRGPTTSGKDGCACPFTIDLIKNVLPRTVVPCTPFTYYFGISNLAGSDHTGITLSDTMPEAFVILSVDDNPYGGTITGIGTNILQISNMVMPLGQDSIAVTVEALPFTAGVFKNQAHLDNLPEGLGGRTPSDDPTTFLADDSTTIEVVPLVVDLQTQQQNLCEGSTIELVANTLSGINYQWNTGNTSASQMVNQAGIYAVTITNGCEIEIDSVFISEEPISVDLGAEITINLGDYLTLTPTTNAIGTIQYLWSEKEQAINCDDCERIEVRPFFDTNYELQIISPSGCIATAQVPIKVTKERGIYIPNVFSPNLDGINDTFYIMGKGYAQILSFQVFDRWGNKVFERSQGSINDPTISWDGIFKNKKMNSGVFGYYAKVIYLDEIEEEFFGDVTLVR